MNSIDVQTCHDARILAVGSGASQGMEITDRNVAGFNVKTGENASSWAIIAGLRLFLAFAVLLGHCSLYVKTYKSPLWGIGYFNQGSAVFGFFVLSGYSIAASLAREPSGYYRRRVIRIWPLYLICLIVGVLVYLPVKKGMPFPQMDGLPPLTILPIVTSLFMLQSIVSPPLATVGPIWSLSIEWWLYMIAPILNRLKPFMLAGLCLLSYEAFLILHSPDMSKLECGKSFIGSAWLWISGFFYYRHKNTSYGFAILVYPSVFAALIGWFVGYPYFITIAVLLLSCHIKLKDVIRKILNFCGDLSFPIYLFHMPVMVLALQLGVRSPNLIVIYSVLTAAAALYGVDYPSRAIGKRWLKRCAVTRFSS